MSKEFLWNSWKLQEKFKQYSDQKIRWPRNSYEILENYKKSSTNIPIRKLDDHRILMKFLTLDDHRNSRKSQEKFNQCSDQKIRQPRNSYEILEITGNGHPIF